MENKEKKGRKRPTVGALSSELLRKENPTVDPTEQMRESLTGYDQNIYDCVDRGKKDFSGDFFIVIITKKEPLMPNVLRNYFMPRHSCPTPDYDQTVYKFDRVKDEVEFIWVIPAKHTCLFLIANRLEVPLEQHQLLKFVLEFADGSLMKYSQKLNKEIGE
jgi:hypothetical protein